MTRFTIMPPGMLNTVRLSSIIMITLIRTLLLSRMRRALPRTISNGIRDNHTKHGGTSNTRRVITTVIKLISKTNKPTTVVSLVWGVRFTVVIALLIYHLSMMRMMMIMIMLVMMITAVIATLTMITPMVMILKMKVLLVMVLVTIVRIVLVLNT